MIKLQKKKSSSPSSLQENLNQITEVLTGQSNQEC